MCRVTHVESRSQDNIQVPVLSIHIYLGLEIKHRSPGLHSKHLNPLNHLLRPTFYYFLKTCIILLFIFITHVTENNQTTEAPEAPQPYLKIAVATIEKNHDGS